MGLFDKKMWTKLKLGICSDQNQTGIAIEIVISLEYIYICVRGKVGGLREGLLGYEGGVYGAAVATRRTTGGKSVLPPSGAARVRT